MCVTNTGIVIALAALLSRIDYRICYTTGRAGEDSAETRELSEGEWHLLHLQREDQIRQLPPPNTIVRGKRCTAVRSRI